MGIPGINFNGIYAVMQLSDSKMENYAVLWTEAQVVERIDIRLAFCHIKMSQKRKKNSVYLIGLAVTFAQSSSTVD